MAIAFTFNAYIRGLCSQRSPVPSVSFADISLHCRESPLNPAKGQIRPLESLMNFSDLSHEGIIGKIVGHKTIDFNKEFNRQKSLISISKCCYRV